MTAFVDAVDRGHASGATLPAEQAAKLLNFIELIVPSSFQYDLKRTWN